MVSYVLATGDGIESLVLTGSSAISATGNATDTSITGNSASNTIVGGSGSETINGGAGKDLLTGGGGTDTFVFSKASDSSLTGYDQIVDFAAGDKINIHGLNAPTQLANSIRAATNGIPTTLAADTLEYYTLGTSLFLVGNDSTATAPIDFKVELLAFGGHALSTGDFIV
jgi:Ca2+-binding RTX toxin-like protein